MLFKFVDAYVRMCVHSCMRTCVRACVRVRTTWVHACKHTRVHAHMCICVHAFTRARVHTCTYCMLLCTVEFTTALSREIINLLIDCFIIILSCISYVFIISINMQKYVIETPADVYSDCFELVIVICN